MIYDHRLEVKLGWGGYCERRVDSKYDYEGCPYNTNKPILR